MNKNNNIATIYHDRHDQLKLLAGSPAKAEFLSKCIYWWQISKYKIKNSDYIWFTRTSNELAAGSSLSESSVGRYLRDFAQKGLIEKRVIKRYSRKHNHDIACLHIRITEKLLALLKTYSQKPSTSCQTEEGNINPESKILPQLDDTPSVNLTVPTINKGNFLNTNMISTVSENSVNKLEKQTVAFQKTIFQIEKEIGERVSEEIKDQIKGMLCNVLKEQGNELKRNERLFAEVLFSVTNAEQFKGIACMKHRINIAANLIRKKKWSTPKGFYNHWDIGQRFKERDESHRRRLQREKLERELLGITEPQRIAEIKARFEASFADEARFDKPKAYSAQQKEQLRKQRQLEDEVRQINQDIFAEARHLKDMEEAYQKGFAYSSSELIEQIGIKLARLYSEQERIQLALQQYQNEWVDCA